LISAVIDTNVIISGVLFGGEPGRVLLLAAQGDFEFLISDAILNELTGVLQRPKFKLPLSYVEQLRMELSHSARLIVTHSSIRAVKADLDDNRILECAVDGKASYIVTGDSDLLDLRTFRKIRIVTPSEFLEILARQK
jgi:putative PIN family toxin of toxin-antitoxin system